MRPASAVLGPLALLCASCVAPHATRPAFTIDTESPHCLVFRSSGPSNDFIFAVTESMLRDAPSWAQLSAAPPLSSEKALAAANAWLSGQVTNTTEYPVVRILLRRAFSPRVVQVPALADLGAAWLYVVEYDATFQWKTCFGPQLRVRVPVLMNGKSPAAQPVPWGSHVVDKTGQDVYVSE
jgi:hypothetical protein